MRDWLIGLLVFGAIAILVVGTLGGLGYLVVMYVPAYIAGPLGIILVFSIIFAGELQNLGRAIRLGNAS